MGSRRRREAVAELTPLLRQPTVKKKKKKKGRKPHGVVCHPSGPEWLENAGVSCPCSKQGNHQKLCVLCGEVDERAATVHASIREASNEQPAPHTGFRCLFRRSAWRSWTFRQTAFLSFPISQLSASCMDWQSNLRCDKRGGAGRKSASRFFSQSVVRGRGADEIA
ncbi:hypothetical protein LZ31DRAFT_131612 [Colletotrichum somersetense]|nr:hypothetical protein LZ31DRAFT_131612 [Colletotrichum somersetense]